VNDTSLTDRATALDSVLYTATATSDGGREGRAVTDDGRLDVVVSVPEELGGPGTGTNPEQLFAAGFAACFHSALQLVARRAKHDLGESSVTAQVGIGPISGGPGYGLQVDLSVSVPALDREQATALVTQADVVCPYSNATRGNVVVSHQIAD
jgi:osmotically inducible protein OsmC